MSFDVVIVGAGPVGATLALGLADSDVRVAVLDARAEGETPRGERSLALSHGARLILERRGVWGVLAACRGRRHADHRHRHFASRRLRHDAPLRHRARSPGAGLCRQLSRAAGRARCGARAQRGSTSVTGSR